MIPDIGINNVGIGGVSGVTVGNVEGGSINNLIHSQVNNVLDPHMQEIFANNGTTISEVRDNDIRDTFVVEIADAREIITPLWVREPPQALPIEVPVVVNIGKPIVNMPGCVTVHRENTGRDPSKNKMLVNDDPKGNTTLCDAGMPSYNVLDYQSQGLTWTTVTPEEPEPDGVDSGSPPPAPDIDPPGTPDIPPQTVEGETECPGPKDLRIGDYSTSGNEKVSGHELNQDNICVTLWEDVGFTEKYLPSANIVTTTATIAVVATSSALLAKPLADLLLKVVKPVIKKVVTKVKKIMGKTEPVLSVRERLLAQRDRNRAVMELRKALKK